MLLTTDSCSGADKTVEEGQLPVSQCVEPPKIRRRLYLGEDWMAVSSEEKEPMRLSLRSSAAFIRQSPLLCVNVEVGYTRLRINTHPFAPTARQPGSLEGELHLSSLFCDTDMRRTRALLIPQF